ncbi:MULTISPECIES: rod-binding protein [Sinorhizobium]|uniref:Flagellar protein FlgJ n=1 Tax=Rhizobium fredii TaxID=380 RepID=A0A2L0H1E6_RHIFR|nr:MULTISPECIES: rod-binding protein [Sinorhizobium]ASY55308.1 Flagellar protein FlgJ [peptidoglycan hydrolase] [Sinorhizobium sp. CCBAU 05631]AUX75280.1 flagellar protein FlgJ [Sinorhizobium fredii]
MAISPPSDLVLDVVRAADPAEVQEAQARLKSNRAAFQATSLAENGKGFAAAVSVLNSSEGSTGLGDISNRVEPKKVPETYRKFEAMVLQNFVKSMLPSESENVFGKGTSGEVWKGMMAEQIANVLADGGGIGIADRMVGSDPAERANARLDDDTSNLAAGMIHEFERNAGLLTADEKKNQA